MGAECGLGLGSRRLQRLEPPLSHPLEARGDSSGIWEGFQLREYPPGAVYKYHIVSRHTGYKRHNKADPFAFYAELPPRNRVCRLGPVVRMGAMDEWMRTRLPRAKRASMPPCRFMEGSSRLLEKGAGGNTNRSLTYRELGPSPPLGDLRDGNGLQPTWSWCRSWSTRFYGSWGYQVTGYFLARRPAMGLRRISCISSITLHRRGIGGDHGPGCRRIFPSDEHGPGLLSTATHLYEHADPRPGGSTPSGTARFFKLRARAEVRNFPSPAMRLFWLDMYPHRRPCGVDAVASMLYPSITAVKRASGFQTRFGGS